MKYKVKGKITTISEKKMLEGGAVVLDYVVEVTSETGYTTPYNFGLYKKAEYAEHVDNFLQFNKIGDEVEVEFTIRGQEYNGKIYNSLNHWRCDKIGEAVVGVTNEADDLPF